MPDLPSFLMPVDTLKHLCTQEGVTGDGSGFSEYRLKEQKETSAATLREFVNFFETDAIGRLLWISDRGFFCSSSFQYQLPTAYTSAKFVLTLTYPDNHQIILEVRAASRSQALATLEYFLELKDKYFTSLTFGQQLVPGLLPSLCLLENHHLEAILKEEKRQIIFDSISFTPEHCEILALRSRRLCFRNCPFRDGGNAFVDAFIANENHRPFSLRLEKEMPFDLNNWIRFLDATRKGRGLNSLELVRKDHLFVESCRSLAVANIGILSLLHCRIRDTRSLIEAIRTGRGPRGLVTAGFSLWPSPFGRSRGWVSLFKTLESQQCCLEYLSIDSLPRGGISVLNTMTSALGENQSLHHFGLRSVKLRRRVWEDLMEKLSTHPNLRSLELPAFQDPDDLITNDVSTVDRTRKERTMDIISLVSINTRIERIEVKENCYDDEIWSRRVVPRLECNRFRSRLNSFHSGSVVRDEAVLGAAIASIATKPSLVWMLLAQSQDTVSSSLGRFLAMHQSAELH